MLSYDESIIEARIAQFRYDLQTKSVVDVVRKYTTFGNSYIFDEETYFQLRSQIADHLGIHPSEVVMVGSAKLGFSIKPQKRYMHFTAESDVDMAVISPHLFDVMWQQVLEYSLSGVYYPKKSEFQEYLFQGWIRPDKLPNHRKFKTNQDWWDFFRHLTNNYRRKISGGVYKSWYHFEMYQSKAVEKCKIDLGI